MSKWIRPKYMPCLPLGNNRSRITECREHRQLSRMAAGEGAVLLKNDNALLPFKKEHGLQFLARARLTMSRAEAVRAMYQFQMCVISIRD